MSFLNTEPAPIQALDDRGPWSRFRVGDPRRRAATLRQLCQGDLPVTLGMPGGASILGTLWSVDESQRRLHFNTEVDAMAIRAVQAQPELWASTYLDDTKVQVLLRDMQSDTRHGRASLRCEGPLDLYLLPRRGSVRVRRPAAVAPTARMPSAPAWPAGLELPLADISISGCAFRQDRGQPLLQSGQRIDCVEIELDDITIIFADICVQHVTHQAAPASAVRVGCEWVQMSDMAREVLHRWIRNGGRRRQMLSLDLD